MDLKNSEARGIVGNNVCVELSDDLRAEPEVHPEWHLPQNKFVKSRWMPGAHVQTIFGSLMASPELAGAKSLRVPLSDGDSVMLHEDLPEHWSLDRTGNPIAIVSIHGLGGCHRSGYVRRLAGLAVNQGWASYRMDMRGAGESGKESAFLYHAGRSDDLLEAVRMVRTLQPTATIIVCGFSLGASITLHLMSHWRNEVRDLVSAAVAVAPPLDLKECAYNLANGWNRIYDRKFARMLWGTLQERPNVLTRFADILPKEAPRTLFQFDSEVTAPLGGYESADAYYDMFSTAGLLPLIEKPTLVLTAKDDPLIPFEVFDHVKYAKNVQLWATDGGGHLGFISRKSATSNLLPTRSSRSQSHSVSASRWLERAVISAIGRRFCDFSSE